MAGLPVTVLDESVALAAYRHRVPQTGQTYELGKDTNITGDLNITGSLTAGTILNFNHLTDLLNVGTNTHAQIDTHISDATIHFTEASIDHAAIQNIGTNSHAAIDTHIADVTVHSKWTTNGSDIYYNTGKVGIGTTSPASEGRLTIEGTAAADGGILVLSATGTTVGTNYGSIKFKKADGSGAGAGVAASIRAYDPRTNGANASLMFSVGNASGNDTPVMWLDGITGNLGIGTATDEPAYKLSVGGWVNADSGFVINAGVTWTEGTGSPEGVVTAPVGSFFSRTDGGAGTTFYVKESGTGNTGWVGK